MRLSILRESSWPCESIHSILNLTCIADVCSLSIRYGLSHTYNTKVGNDFIRGVSGGERKRVSIAEMALAKPSVAAWVSWTTGDHPDKIGC